MATTYKKGLVTLVIHTLGGGEITVSDTASASDASNALYEFEHGETMHVPGEGGAIALIPFHAVDYIVKTVAESDSITRPDPYCKDE